MSDTYKLIDGTVLNKADIKGIECKFAHFLKPPALKEDDYHLVKEAVVMKDGRVFPNIRYIKNFMRPYYITKPSARSHKEKKEWEDLDKVIRYECKQSELNFELSRNLNIYTQNNYLSEICANPYIYGADITSTSYIKKFYADKYPDLFTRYRVATYDIETGVTQELFEQVIVISVTFEDTAYVFTTQPFIKSKPNYRQEFEEKAQRALKQYNVESRFKVVLKVVEDEIVAIMESFKLLHQLKPDIVSIWNMNYDIPFILKRLRKYDIDPRTVMCEPSVPFDLRICRYKEGAAKKITSSGNVKPINPASRWHVFYLSASFVVLDAMCVYKQIRLSKQEESSYALDAILKKELKIQKLKHPGLDHLEKLEWHVVMQLKHQVDYLVYNMIDTISLLLLDEKTKDLSFSLPNMSALTDFEFFNSQPKKIAVALFFVLLEKGKVLGSTGRAPKTRVLPEHNENDDDEEEEEDEILSLKQWIVTLKTAVLVKGTEIASDSPGHTTGLRCFTQDCDMTAAYPSCIQALNVSKETTARELIGVKGIDEAVFRLRNIDVISSAKMNAYRYCREMMNFPSFQELEQLF